MKKAIDSSNQPGSSRGQPRVDSRPHRSVSRCAHIADADAADRLKEEIESKMRVELSTRAGHAECAMARPRWERRMGRHWNPDALRRMKKLRKRLRDKLGEVEQAFKRAQDARRRLLQRDLPPHERRGCKRDRSPQRQVPRRSSVICPTRPDMSSAIRNLENRKSFLLRAPFVSYACYNHDGRGNGHSSPSKQRLFFGAKKRPRTFCLLLRTNFPRNRQILIREKVNNTFAAVFRHNKQPGGDF